MTSVETEVAMLIDNNYSLRHRRCSADAGVAWYRRTAANVPVNTGAKVCRVRLALAVAITLEKCRCGN